MPDEKSDALSPSQQRQSALSRWDNECRTLRLSKTRRRTDRHSAADERRTGAVTYSRDCAGELGDHVACRRNGQATGTCSRNGDLHLAKVRFYSSPSDNSGSGPNERSRRSSHSLPNCDASMRVPTAPSSKCHTSALQSSMKRHYLRGFVENTAPRPACGGSFGCLKGDCAIMCLNQIPK